MTSGKLCPVSTCMIGNGKLAGAERLLGQPQQNDRVLAAAEQQHRALELGGHLAEDVDRLGLEGLEVGELVMDWVHQRAGWQGTGLSGSARHHTTWIPHSVLSLPAQRPSRPSPGCVHGAQPIEA